MHLRLGDLTGPKVTTTAPWNERFSLSVSRPTWVADAQSPSGWSHRLEPRAPTATIGITPRVLYFQDAEVAHYIRTTFTVDYTAPPPPPPANGSATSCPMLDPLPEAAATSDIRIVTDDVAVLGCSLHRMETVVADGVSRHVASFIIAYMPQRVTPRDEAHFTVVIPHLAVALRVLVLGSTKPNAHGLGPLTPKPIILQPLETFTAVVSIYNPSRTDPLNVAQFDPGHPGVRVILPDPYATGDRASVWHIPPLQRSSRLATLVFGSTVGTHVMCHFGVRLDNNRKYLLWYNVTVQRPMPEAFHLGTIFHRSDVLPATTLIFMNPATSPEVRLQVKDSFISESEGLIADRGEADIVVTRNPRSLHQPMDDSINADEEERLLQELSAITDPTVTPAMAPPAAMYRQRRCIEVRPFLHAVFGPGDRGPAAIVTVDAAACADQVKHNMTTVYAVVHVRMTNYIRPVEYVVSLNVFLVNVNVVDAAGRSTTALMLPAVPGDAARLIVSVSPSEAADALNNALTKVHTGDSQLVVRDIAKTLSQQQRPQSQKGGPSSYDSIVLPRGGHHRRINFPPSRSADDSVLAVGFDLGNVTFAAFPTTVASRATFSVLHDSNMHLRRAGLQRLPLATTTVELHVVFDAHVIVQKRQLRPPDTRLSSLFHDAKKFYHELSAMRHHHPSNPRGGPKGPAGAGAGVEELSLNVSITSTPAETTGRIAMFNGRAGGIDEAPPLVLKQTLVAPLEPVLLL